MNSNLFSFLLIFIFAFIAELKSQDKIKVRSGELKVRKHCLIPWNDSWYHAEILAMDDKNLTLKIHDHNKTLDQWPKATVAREQVKPIIPYKGNTLEGLIDEMRSTHKLESLEITNAFNQIDRAWFCAEFPYYDASVDIGYNACISTPHMHISVLELSKHLFNAATSILDLGSGSGHLTALYAKLCKNAFVVGIECLPELVEKSQFTIDDKLEEDLQKRILFLKGDGEKGCLSRAPFDIIHVGFMCETIPFELVEQLRPGGRMIIPVGNTPSQIEGLITGDLMVIDKKLDGSIIEYRAFSCSFVPSSNSMAYTSSSSK